MNNIETATKRYSARGQVAKLVIDFASESELVKADKIFGRTAMSFPDFLFLHDIACRANGT